MKRSVALLCVALSAFGAQAVEPEAPQVTVSAEDCKRLLKHIPDADVAYKPGVDVHGKAVVPAETATDTPFKVPDEIVMDFSLDFAGSYGISGAGGAAAQADLFKIKYDIAQGVMTVNGQPLSKSDAQAVARACKQMLDQGQD